MHFQDGTYPILMATPSPRSTRGRCKRDSTRKIANFWCARLQGLLYIGGRLSAVNGITSNVLDSSQSQTAGFISLLCRAISASDM